MDSKETRYIGLIALHVLLGVVIYYIPDLAKIYGIIILLYSLFYVIKKGNRNNEVLLVSAYIVGSDVFLRMTGGFLLYEFSKYGVMFFLFFRNDIQWFFKTLGTILDLFTAFVTRSFCGNRNVKPPI